MSDPVERVHTHDAAQALLRYAVPGARVDFYPTRGEDHRSDARRGYTITVRPHGRDAVAVHGAYALPAPVAQLARGAIAQADAALARG
jgi:hypothetical protein